jgi:hypothetical protein
LTILIIFRVEAAHSYIKRFILSSQGDLLTTWLLIEQAIASQFQNIKAIAARDRIRTPLNLDRACYSACFNHITTPALRKVHSNYISAKRPLQSCTGVFTATTGLPCAHRVDYIQEEGLSLLPDDFHPHWYWDRYSALPEPLLEPLCVITYIPSASSSAHSTRRIPSGWEASQPQLRRCGLCREIGHTRASLRCPVNIRYAREQLRAESATQITPDPASQFIPRATVLDILNSAGQSGLKSALQSVLDSGDQLIPKSTIQSILESTTQYNPEPASRLNPEPASCPNPEPASRLNPESAIQLDPELATQPVLEPESGPRSLIRFSISPGPRSPPPLLPSLSPDPEPAAQPIPKPDTRPIWPGRPELIHKRYIAEKVAWLKAHPDVRPAQYRKERGLEHYPKRWLNENRNYLGYQRLDLEIETLLDYIEHPPNWTDEEVEAWLDWDAEETIEVERQVQAEFDIRGGLSGERGVRGLMRQIKKDIKARRKKYRFAELVCK